MADPGTLSGMGFGAPAPPATAFTRLSWGDAATLSLITVLATFFFPNLGQLQQQLFGRRVHRRVRWLAAIVDPDLSVTISQYETAGSGRMMTRSDAYEEAKAYIGAQGPAGASRSRSARHLRAEVPRNAADKLLLNMLDGEEVADEFQGATVWWSAYTVQKNNARGDVETGYRLHYEERHKDLVLDTYLPHVRREGRAIIVKDRQRKIFTNTSDHDGWADHVPFDHPKTFDTLAMDPEKKQDIMDDLEAFKNGKEYYAHIGKPWKRGYLLYGPPGTGKSSMVAAMANFLEYDVYDIELTSVRSNTHLRQLLIGIKSKSVIVIEDIDCSLDLTGARDKTKPAEDDENDDDASTSTAAAAAAVVCAEENKKSTSRSQVTLSGVLNFIDGLWSACGEERIIVFTTNHVQKLDPALIRKGRMDKRIEMSYCSYDAFKFLAKLYLDVEWHELFGVIGELLGEVKMTPVDVAEKLTRKRKYDDAGLCLAGLVTKLETMKRAKGSA
jgi:hypothetical protein